MVIRVVERAIHQECMHKTEFSTLERFGEHISPHLFSRTVLKINFTRVMIMPDKELFGFDVFRMLGAGNIAVFGQGKGAHIVLVDDVGLDFVSLGFKELSSPENITDFIAETNKFAFAGAFRRNFLFER